MHYTCRRILSLILFSLAATCAARACWIPLKAELAQLLLRRAWVETVAGGDGIKPWPWADTWPVARLRAPRHGVDLFVLSGATGRTLAFGPGHVDGTARPGRPGNCVLSGHRDTHFRFLEHLDPGDDLELVPPDSRPRHFRVTGRHVVYDSDVSVLEDTDVATLTLITCYPFDAIVPGGPLRFVVQAEEVEGFGSPNSRG